MSRSAAPVPGAASGEPTLLPADVANGHILVQARADGRPVTLVVDTGSSTSSLDAAWAAGAGITSIGRKVEAAGTDRMQVTLATIGRLQVGDIELSDVTTALVPLGPVAEASGRVIHGTLGYDLFKRYVVQLDYAGASLRLWEPEQYQAAGGVSVPIELVHRVPVVRAVLRAGGGPPIEARLILDLGSSSLGVRLSAGFAEAHTAELGGMSGYETQIGVGMGGALLGRVGRLEELGLGGIVLRGSTVGIAGEAKGALALPLFDGTVGAPVLERLGPIVDYARSRVILVPGDGFDAPFPVDASGLLLDSPAPDFSVARVRFVVGAGVAAEAGLEAGDEILTVDGEPVGALGLSPVRELFREAGAERRLRVRRGTAVREVRLRLRALV